MLVVIAIITIITLIVITSQGNFNKSLILSNAAYDVALAIRSAESYGLGGRLTTTLANNAGYGLHFTAGTNTFIFFADNYPAASGSVCHPTPPTGASSPEAKIGDCIYTAGSDSLVLTNKLNNAITISKICADNNGTWTCSPSLTSLDITYVRPIPSPFISASGAYAASISAACIELKSQQGTIRDISINSTGEINGNAASCP